MALSYEKRHQPDELSFHQRKGGFVIPATPIASFLLLEDDPGDGSSILLLEDDPGDGSSRLELEDDSTP